MITPREIIAKDFEDELPPHLALIRADGVIIYLQAAGWQIVPVEPTGRMLDVACVAWADLYPAWDGQKPQPTGGDVALAIYRAILAETASLPAPPARQGE